MVLVALIPLLWVGVVHAQPVGRSDLSSARVLSELSLSANQQDKIGTILADARKASIRLTASMNIAGIDLRRELEKDAASEKRVGTLIEQISSLEGELRKSRVISWLRIRKLLNAKQRLKLDALKGVSTADRGIGNSRGSRNSGVRTLEVEEFTDSRADVKDPFAEPRPEREDATCDEVMCLVHPGKACCRRFNKGPASATLPRTIPRGEISEGIGKVKARVTSCGKDHGASGTIQVRFTIGANGKVQSARANGGTAPLRRCLQSAVKRATFGKSQKGITVSYPFVFRQ
jgi:Spy/CpxP family protein refolding chaperone